ncbi:MAG: SGNH/GDSL hydrolase family protein [Sporichthyaceae bacterium]
MIPAARRVLSAAAFGGTGVALTGTALVGVLLTEAKLARHVVGLPKTAPPAADGFYGTGTKAPVSFVMLGDSCAAGLGAACGSETPGARMAVGLSEAAGAPVRFTNVAKVGAQSTDLARQVGLALAAAPTVALIMIGANDVTHRIQPSLAVAHLGRAVRRLRESGCEVVVATCPDLGTVEPIAQPLRYLVRRWSRQLAAAQTIVTVEAGGRTVSLGDLIGPEFTAAPREMFSPDRFHPSSAGYNRAATALLPSVLAALGLGPIAEVAPDAAREDATMPIALAAVEAVDRPGTEVAPAAGHGHRGVLRGPLALLRHRRRHELPAAQMAAPERVQAA